MLHIKFGFDWPSGFREKDLLKSVDNERTDDGSWSSYISSPCQPHGSGELVRNLLQIQPNFPTLGWLPILTYVCDISLFRRDLPIFQQISLFRISKFPYTCIYNVYISLFEINNFLLCLIILPISKSKSPYRACWDDVIQVSLFIRRRYMTRCLSLCNTKFGAQNMESK